LIGLKFENRILVLICDWLSSDDKGYSTVWDIKDDDNFSLD